MKKILAVLIAISMVATMAFAADFAFSVKTSGNVAAWNLGDNYATLISRSGNESSAELNASVDGAAGVSAKLKAGAADADVKFTDAAIWIKPVEGVKVIFGAQNYSLGPDLNWDGAGDYGPVTANGFGVEYTGIENLIVAGAIQESVVTNAVPAVAAKVTYKVGEVATIAATVDNDLNWGAAVNGKVSVVSYMVAADDKADDDMRIYENVSASLDLDPVTLTLSETVKPEFDADTKLDTVAAEASVKAAYDIVSCEVKVASDDVTADKLALTTTITPEVKKTGKIGEADWELGAKAVVTIPSAGDVTVAVTVPYSVKIAF